MGRGARRESRARGLGGVVGADPPRTAAWGYCDRDFPRKGIVSPYPFKTAQEHYQALLAETRRAAGRPSIPTPRCPANGPGRYEWPSAVTENWYSFALWNQVPTILSLLTPEYQQRMVQELYHEGHDNAPMWPATYCWPEGFMRRWHLVAVTSTPHTVLATPSLVQIRVGSADNFITEVHVGREFRMDGPVPRLGADVPRWYGETIGFWDRDVLVTWTSNVQGWKVHGMFEFSSRMQSIEIYTPTRDRAGRFYRAEPRKHPVRPRGAGAADPHRAQLQEAVRVRRGRSAGFHQVRADHLLDRRPAHAEGAAVTGYRS